MTEAEASRGFDDEDDAELEALAARASRVMAEITSFARTVQVTALFAPRKNLFGDLVLGIELTDLFAERPGHGAGTQVMRRLIGAADRDSLSVWVKPDGPRSRAFYERFGFALPARSLYGFELVRHPAVPAWMLTD